MSSDHKLVLEELIKPYLIQSSSSASSSSFGSDFILPKIYKFASNEGIIESEDLVSLKRHIKLEVKLSQIENRQIANESVTTDWMLGLENRIRTVEERSQELELEKKYLRLNIEVLSEIGELQDNWNNYGAYKFRQELIFMCMRIITNTNLKFQPEIFPTANQSIQFEYEPDDEHYLEVEIFNDKIKLYSRINSEIIRSDNLTVEDIIQEINQFQTQYGN